MALKKFLVALFVFTTVLLASASPMKLSDADPAMRPWVGVYGSVKESCFCIFIGYNVGSGFFVTPSGYAVTNSHVVRLEANKGVQTIDGAYHRFRVVAEDQLNDLAILKVTGTKPYKPSVIGRSGDLKVGDPVMAVGNPQGIGFTATQGIISAIGRTAMSDYGPANNLLQTDTSIDHGNSGGPLFNIIGQVIGVMSAGKTDVHGLNFAIPMDKVITLLPLMLSPEKRYGFILGMIVDQAGAVTEVIPNSPAQTAGMSVGDIVIMLNGISINSGLDFTFAIAERKPGDVINMRLKRAGANVDVSLKLGKVEQLPATKAEGLVSGLNCDYYEGKWEQMPDFSNLKSLKVEKFETVHADSYKGKNDFALRFTGFIKVPEDGAYTFMLGSYHGSQLYIDNQLVVDNNGTHGPVELTGFISLKAGLHPIKVGYFKQGGDSSLKLSWEGPNFLKQVVPTTALFYPGTGK
jgi:S1-C subfamily serine protease